MGVLYVEGVAIRDGPESCVGIREGACEVNRSGDLGGLIA